MQLWVGLGNPGPEYALNRHNAGFQAVDAIAEVYGFSAPKKAFQGWTQEGRVGGDKVVILKPGTYMNESGRSVRAALDFFKIAAADITVFHDELDIAPLTLKVKTGGGTAGQNGLKSIVQHIGPDFRRVRIGIGHPGHKDRVTGHVLSNWHKTEIEPLSDLLGAIAAEADWLAKGDDVRFMNDVALRMRP
ncbi:aminoacyl-tRNA hydrolase [uncultured Sphingomonas sp.]|uniref:aminoacyl-tRNA hydrolase n=1 Tax=uncultured Sphingomonas sp. TaxID=158754 RepID=UPI0025F310F3|nr:aminoacyl-tRNA hydrolase [uncultured Sphingomonas sp.]